MTCVGETNPSGLSTYQWWLDLWETFMWRPGVLSHNTGNHIYANGWLHDPHFWANVRSFRKATSDAGWRTLHNTCAFVVFVVVCCVMSAVHSTLENACTYKVSGCVLGPKGKLSGVSRFQVLDKFLTQIYLCGPQKHAAAFWYIMVHSAAFCSNAFVSFYVILVNSHAFLCTFMYSTAF